MKTPNRKDARQRFRPTSFVEVADWLTPKLLDTEAMIELVPALFSDDEQVASRAASKLELQAKMLLFGWIDRTGEHRFFKPGSREENLARTAITHLLAADRVSRSLLDDLANLFDSTSVNARSLKFGFRREGGPKNVLKHRRIAKEMRDSVRAGATVQDAVNRACDAHGISERTARTIWAKYGKPLLQ